MPAAARATRVDDILSAVVDASGRLTDEDALYLFENAPLPDLSQAAHAVRLRKNDPGRVTYIVDRNINYTNICLAVCDFCAFYRSIKDPEGYVLSFEELGAKIEETKELGGNQILLQGGMHPKLKIDWYEDMLRFIKREYGIHLHAFSAPEIHAFAKINRLPYAELLARLREAGLDSIPGGGAEILVDRVREEITRGKCTTDEWLEVHRVWHGLGGRSTATMMFGHVETLAERVEHFRRVRELQDETGGFTAFIDWTYQPENTRLAESHDVTEVGSWDYLRTTAIARLYLDNVQHIQASWVTQGGRVGQISLFYGCDDMGSIMIEENVVKAAGASFRMTEETLRGLVREAGYAPHRRNFFYEIQPEPDFA
ncbi:MAG: cyclic dehypoxanthinyl futalosine synthase [Candidatus Sumerlaeota bacterium]|nr:cyclic dehypoxanthinyl futalosine synthase [Candidatus Sumerlaeota bacterium]